MNKIAIIQDEPTFGNLELSIQRTIEYIEIAGKAGAKLIVFGETWLGGYPAWIDVCPDVAKWQHPSVLEAWQSIYENGLEIPSNNLDLICEVAANHQIVVVMGINEVVKTGKGNSTIYNSIITIDKNGKLANHHRKLMPTFNEKLIYGQGDGYGLKAIDTDFGRLGSLICWEHWMPMTRQAMHDESEDIHIALWPSVKKAHQIASQNYAFEGRCAVIAVGQIVKVGDIPAGLKLPKQLKKMPNALLCNGGSCVIDPDAEFILEPQFDKKGIFYVNLPNQKEWIKYKMTLSVSGH
ncbi:MAG: carbon-nitrogen hydrolase family protein, partial [Saprospiraceae bacterium]